jgi:hypothetical protein
MDAFRYHLTGLEKAREISLPTLDFVHNSKLEADKTST